MIPAAAPYCARFAVELQSAVLQAGGVDCERLLMLWRQYPVLVVRKCSLTPTQLLAVAQLFGAPIAAAVQEHLVDRDQFPPEILVVSNIKHEGRAIGHLGNGELGWHTDMCYTPHPALASMLYAVEVPPSGGDTSFMDMRAVCRSLPAGLLARVRQLQCKHDDSCTAAGDLRVGRQAVVNVVNSTGAVHPLIWRDVRSGEESLYLGRRLHAYIPGLAPLQSEALLEELWSYCVDPGLIRRHRWQPGDLVIWDNRVTMHRRDAFPEQSRRLMLRAQVRE